MEACFFLHACKDRRPAWHNVAPPMICSHPEHERAAVLCWRQGKHNRNLHDMLRAGIATPAFIISRSCERTSHKAVCGSLFKSSNWQGACCDCEALRHFAKEMNPAGLEPAIPGSVGRCLIHWATGPMRNCAKTDFSNDLAIMGTKLPST
jgi:hypothetical protein